MALMEVNFFSKALMRPVTMNVILPADKVFFEEETEEENKPFKTLYLLHGVMGNYTDWVTGTCIKRWAEEKNLAVVMPSGANMFYMDHPNANENYSEFIGKDLVKITRRMFPLSHKKEDTFIEQSDFSREEIEYGIRCVMNMYGFDAQLVETDKEKTNNVMGRFIKNECKRKLTQFYKI